jgi:4-cresol dehydrogenase (hydroxylating)
MFFSPIIPQSGEAILEFNRVMQEASRSLPVLRSVPIMNFSPFALPAGFFERSFFMVLGFPITNNPELNKACVQAFRELIRVGAEHGWGEYRTPPIYYDQVMDIYSFNDHSLLRLHETIKDAIDPNGILSPGRFGIWPKHLRGNRP